MGSASPTSTMPFKPHWAGPWPPRVLEADRQFSVAVRLAPEFRDNIDTVRNIKVGITRRRPVQRLYPAQRTRHPSRSTPAPPTSFVSATSVLSRSSSACADAISRGAVAEAQQRIARRL